MRRLELPQVRRELRLGSLFSGIGLLELGLERAGLGRTAWQCEIDDFCTRILARHWPTVRRFRDVKKLNPPATDIICGGFPCQPFSVAGKQRGLSDARWLWPEFARVVAASQASIVVVENVPGLRKAGLRPVLADLTALGFNAEWHCFRASDLGAPHERNRIWLVAYAGSLDIRQKPGWLARSIERQAAQVARRATARGAVTDADGIDGRRELWEWIEKTGLTATNADGIRRLESAWGFAELRGWSGKCGWRLGGTKGMDDERAARLDVGRRRKALGNAVVVACAEAVGVAIREALTSAPAE
ncbi:MAG: DNA cytosine methyltransferase [Desulfurellales bacterium]|nr:MAG: DNA cytosine methyltransferase [Desulfurellales bacterium]